MEINFNNKKAELGGEEDYYGDGGDQSLVRVKTREGKEYVFQSENCWIEGLESLYFKGDILCHGFNDNEVLTPYDLAGVFYFSQSMVGDNWGIACWIFNFLCGKLTAPQLAEKLKNHPGFSIALQAVDTTQCGQEKMMEILEPWLPTDSGVEIKPYIDFAEEVKSLGAIKSVDIEIDFS